jgi:hypothetical protein
MVALPWWHFPDRNDAAQPVYEAARHAQQELKPRVRGVRPIARQGDGRTPPAAEVIRGDCGAGRRALTDDGRPPLGAAGLRRHDHLAALADRLDRGAQRGASPTHAPVGGRFCGGAWWTSRLGGLTCAWPTDGCLEVSSASIPRPRSLGRR